MNNSQFNSPALHVLGWAQWRSHWGRGTSSPARVCPWDSCKSDDFLEWRIRVERVEELGDWLSHNLYNVVVLSFKEINISAWGIEFRTWNYDIWLAKRCAKFVWSWLETVLFLGILPRPRLLKMNISNDDDVWMKSLHFLSFILISPAMQLPDWTLHADFNCTRNFL